MFLRLITILTGIFFIGSAYADPANYSAIMAVDAKGSADSEYTGRYEGSTIVGQTFQKFNEIALPSGPTENRGKIFGKTVALQGSIQRTLYVSPEERSSLDVFGNYMDAIKAKGFEPVFECANNACGVGFTFLKYKWNVASTVVVSVDAEDRRVALSKGMFSKILDPRYALLKKGAAGQETYLAIFAAQNVGGSFGDVSKALKSRVGVLIEVVEPKLREDKIVTLTADEIGSTIGADGRVVIYGLYFDFDKAEINPESAPQLAEMVSYLTNDPKIKVYVVGHTDTKGDLDYNIKLSTARAKSVTAALVAAGIDATRLSAKGLGPLAPLATNRTEAGQAKNRRVELVEQ